MSTKSLDLSLPLRHHRRQLSSELTANQFTKDLKPVKLDSNKLQSYEELGARLLEDRLLLSALELYAELGEAGHEILCLKQFFSNPGNFEKSAKTEISRTLVRSLSQTTLDSLDYATISEDGDRAGGDRVAILEFELRKAKETITALRENLTQQVELEQNASSSRSETESNSSRIGPASNTLQSTPEPMRAYEQKAINFLIHEYLLTHGYRLTSITFADENPEQDFEHWDDVGLNTERPPDLLSIYRHRNRPFHHHAVQTVQAETQTNESSDNLLLHESDSADVTIQMGCVSGTSICADESQDINAALSKPELTVSSSAPIRPSTVAASQLPSSSGSQQIPASHSSVKFEPHSAPFPHPPPPLQIEKSARALKDELQQGVEDVCQKLNSFFGKPPSLTGSSGNAGGGGGGGGGGSRPPSSAFGAPGKPTDNRPVFSLFNSK